MYAYESLMTSMYLDTCADNLIIGHCCYMDTSDMHE